MIRAYSLTISALFLFACGDSEPQLTVGGPGQVTGPCIQGQCLAGLQCFVDECVPGAGSNSNSNSNGNSDGDPEDPTTTGGTTGVSDGVTGGNMTQPTTASSNDPGTTTGDPSTTSTTTNVTTNPTNPMTTGVDRTTGDETDTWDDSASDSQNFILPETDSGGDDPCDTITCGIGETCAIVGEEPQCLMHCHPLDPEYCGTGNVCVQHLDVFVCAPDASGDVGAVSQGCAYANGCDPGLACLEKQWVAGCNGQYCCTPFCDLTVADPCVQYDMQCVPWWEQGMAPQGFEDVGICAVA